MNEFLGGLALTVTIILFCKWFFKPKCNHPFEFIHVYKKETVTDSHRAIDHEHVDYHLYCRNCGESLTLQWARCKKDYYDGLFTAVLRDQSTPD